MLEDVYGTFEGANALVVMIGHDEYRKIDFSVVKRVMRTMVVVLIVVG